VEGVGFFFIIFLARLIFRSRKFLLFMELFHSPRLLVALIVCCRLIECQLARLCFQRTKLRKKYEFNFNMRRAEHSRPAAFIFESISHRALVFSASAEACHLLIEKFCMHEMVFLSVNDGHRGANRRPGI
jgi:hypothetical protein